MSPFLGEIPWPQSSPYPILAALQLLPLAAAALVFALRHRAWVTSVAWSLAAAEWLLAVDLYRRLDAQSALFQFAERLPLFGAFDYHAGADGISVLFLLLATLLMLLVSIYLRARELPEAGYLMSVVLLIEAVLVSLLCTLNLLWFVIAAALEVALAGYLIHHWAVAEQKVAAITRYAQFQSTGLVLLLAGALLAGWHHADVNGGTWSFDLLALAGNPVGGALGSVAFYLLFYGLAIRTPLFPFHGWLPVVTVHGNLALAPAILLGVKVGLYGLVRFVFPIVPEAVERWHNYAMAFAATGIFFAAALAFRQTNLRALMAFAVVSHTSLVVVGLFSLHGTAFQGSLLLAATFGLGSTAMFFMVGFIYHRTRATELGNLGGLFDDIPVIGVAFFVAALAIVGMPSTPGFDAAHLVLEGGIQTFGALPTLLAALGNVASAGFLLWAFQRAFLAPRPAWLPARRIEPATASENFVAVTVILIILVTGFHMEPWLDLVEAPLKLLAARFGGGGGGGH